MVTVAEYIAIRLKQLGAEHLFCVPGNYSAEFLLAAQKAGIECVGTTNELEAGYAADAYSRYKGIGVCSVTYGVGSQRTNQTPFADRSSSCSPSGTRLELRRTDRSS